MNFACISNVCPFTRILGLLHLHIEHMASISYWSSDCVLILGDEFRLL